MTTKPDPEVPFEIDPSALDLEWRGQPRVARAAGVREADARHAHSQAKTALDIVAARLSLQVRKNPGQYDLRDRPNKEEVEAAVTLQPSYQAALAELNDAQYVLDVARAETTAYVDRRKALERLVDLLALDYHSEKEPTARTVAGRSRTPRRPMDEGIDREIPGGK